MSLENKDAKDVNVPVPEEKGKYGWGSLTPSCLQCCLKPRLALGWICWFGLVQGFVVNGINNVNTSTLERRYQLPSSRVGLISSAYDIVAVLLIVPVTYYGAHAHQPRMLAVGALVLAMGSFVMALPQFTAGDYELGPRTSDQCDIFGNASVCTEREQGLANYLYVFMLGQGLHGVGGSVLYTLGIVFIDSHCDAKRAPLYQAAFAGCTIFGPAMGYVFGGMFLQIYVDFYKKDPEKLGVSPSDPRWVGAWWIGFSLASIFGFTVALGLSALPRELPNAAAVRASRKSEVHNDGSEIIASRANFGRSIRDLPTSVRIILCNPTSLCVNLATGAEALIVSGFATFMPKFIQEAFNLSAGSAAVLGGLMAVAGAAGGSVLGGVLVRIFKMKIGQMLKLCAACCYCGIVVIAVTLSCYCERPGIAGVTTEYNNWTLRREGAPNLTATCNSWCHCSTRSYEPICGANNVQYFSPCHAGCFSAQGDPGGTARRYGNCTCLSSLEGNASTTTEVAQAGSCPMDCNTLPLFIFLFFFIILFSFLISVPATMVALRCIPENRRAFGMGIRTIFGRCLGSVPGPVVMGAIYDLACRVWQEGCSTAGSCWIYNRWNVAVYIMALAISVRFVSGSLFVIGLLTYKPPQEPIVMETNVQGGKDAKAVDCKETTPKPGHQNYERSSSDCVTHM